MDSQIILTIPTLVHKEKALDYREEHFNVGEMDINGDGGLDYSKNYEQWIETLTEDMNMKEILPDRVPATTFFAIRKSDDEIVGTIQVRHALNDYLINTGGHIGYGVRPSERRKGYGGKMLSEALLYCKKLGIERVLVTCDVDNEASAKTILKNGGVLENIIQFDGETVKRFWIENK